MIMKLQALSKVKSRVTLKISDVDESHFTTYILTAQNDVDTTQQHITLVEGKCHRLRDVTHAKTHHAGGGQVALTS